MRGLIAISAIVVAFSIGLSGQQRESRPGFEVASVKPRAATPGFQGGSCTGTDTRTGAGPLAQLAGIQSAPAVPGTCAFTNATLQLLMGSAYEFGPGFVLGSAALAGAPDWFNTARFDVQAKAEQPTTAAQLRLMMQRMLEDRFALKWHREQQPADGFALVVVSGGPKMSKGQATGGRLGRAGQAPWTGRNVTMDELARFLAGRLDRPVADETNLAGGYDFTLTWTPGDGERTGLPGLPPDVAARIPRADPVDGPSIYTAVEEQLGLRLERRRVTRDVFLIDSARLPDAN